MSHDVFVTGVGVVCPAGCDTQTAWASLLAGERSIRPIIGLDLAGCRTGFAGQVPGFEPSPGTEDWDRLCQLAAAAAREAVRSAGITPFRVKVNYKLLVSIGSSKGGLESITTITNSLLYNRKRSIVYLNTLKDVTPDAPSRRVASRLAVACGVHSTVAACCTGTLAVIRGVQMIEDGEADAVICGGADASLQPLWFAAFEQMGVLATAHPQLGPGWACRPFDTTRSGFALGEGAGILVLESDASVRDRKTEPIARIAGHASGTDPAGMAQLESDGSSLAHVIGLACRRAGCSPAEIRCIHAHGTATPTNDLVETRAIRKAFGPHAAEVPIVSMKGAIGHLLGGAGAVELALAVLACREGRCPGNNTLVDTDPELEPLHLPRNTFRFPPGPVLKTSLGFGGHLAAVVVAPA